MEWGRLTASGIENPTRSWLARTAGDLKRCARTICVWHPKGDPDAAGWGIEGRHFNSGGAELAHSPTHLGGLPQLDGGVARIWRFVPPKLPNASSTGAFLLAIP